MRSKLLPLAASASAALLLAACTGGSSTAKSAPSANIAKDQTATTPGTGKLDSLSWYGDYRPVFSLDPIKSADYPEETILPNVCTSLLQAGSDYTLKPSLASAWEQTSPTTLQFTVRSGVKFSDGSALTADDVVYSLKRNTIPANGSAFAALYEPVSSIAKTGPDQVTVTFRSADYVFVNAMATLGGSVVSEKYATAKGRNFGTPQAGVLCAGPYSVASYDGTHDLTLKANPTYWDTANQPKAATVKFVFPADPNALHNAISGGAVQGAFDLPPSLINPLKSSAAGKLYIGGAASTPQTVNLVPSSVTSGPLAKPEVRQALSLALDRSAVAAKIWAGAAQPLYSSEGPGMYGSVSGYQAGYDKLTITPDVAKAKQLISSAGASGATVRLAYPSDSDNSTQLATYLQQVGSQIGLNVKLDGMPGAQYGNIFVDAGARKNIDAFITISYLEFPEPAVLMEDYATPGGFQNYNGYSNAQVTSLVKQAEATADPSARATIASQAQAILAQDLPWIPIVAPTTAVFLGKGITGATLTFSFMSSPWLTSVGGA